MRLRGTIRQVRPALAYPIEPARQIYAYRNVQTNQVLYSITRNLRPSALDQLPDLGANNKPVSIRPDLWRPFFVVHFPEPHTGEAQCKYVFDQLLHYRKLHEYYWERPAELERRYSEDQFEHIKEQLEERGGSKKDNPSDIIKRHNKRLKIRTVMNQKANSVADLAASLFDLQRESERTKGHTASIVGEKWREIVELWRAASEEQGIQKLMARREELQQRIPQIVYQESAEYIAARKEYRELEIKYNMYRKRGTRKELRTQLKSQMGQLSTRITALTPVSKLGLQRELRAVEEQLKQMESAVVAVEKAKEDFERAKAKRESAVEAEAEAEAEVEAENVVAQDGGQSTQRREPKSWRSMLHHNLKAATPPPWAPHKYGRTQVKWVEPRDATFAQQWPEEIVQSSEWDVTMEDLRRPPRVKNRPRKTARPTDVTSVAARQLWKMIRERGANNPGYPRPKPWDIKSEALAADPISRAEV